MRRPQPGAAHEPGRVRPALCAGAAPAGRTAARARRTRGERAMARRRASAAPRSRTRRAGCGSAGVVMASYRALVRWVERERRRLARTGERKSQKFLRRARLVVEVNEVTFRELVREMESVSRNVRR